MPHVFFQQAVHCCVLNRAIYVTRQAHAVETLAVCTRSTGTTGTTGTGNLQKYVSPDAPPESNKDPTASSPGTSYL